MIVEFLRKVCATLLLLGAVGLVTGPAHAQDVGQPLRGHDDRVKLDSIASPYSAIGRLNLGAGRQFCSGTLIAPDKVITAAHCLVDGRTKKPYLPSQVHFVAGQRRDKFIDHAAARCLLPLKRKAANGAPDFENFIDDVAIIVLNRPLKMPPVTTAQPYIADPGPLSHPAYSKARPYLLSVHKGCKVLKKSSGTWLTDCDTAYGSSGGPVFANGAAKPKLIAVMSGISRRSDEVFSIAVPVTIWGRMAKTANCDAD